MASHKRTRSDESSQGLDEERYGRNSSFQRYSIEGSYYSSIPSHHPLVSTQLHFNTLDPVLSASTLQQNSNTTWGDLPYQDFNNELEQSGEARVFENFDIQYDQHSDRHLSNGFMAQLQTSDDFTDFQSPEYLHEDPQADSEPTPTIPTLSSSSTAVDQSSPQDAIRICYGTVSRTAVRLAGDMAKLDYKLQETTASYGFGFAGFEVQARTHEMALCFADGATFAFTNEQFCKGLKSILSAFPNLIRLEAIANIFNMRDRILKAKKLAETVIRVDINVFGPKSKAGAVGKMLSDEKLWLQKPDFLIKGTGYENPQFLKLEGFEQPEYEQQPLDLASNQKLKSLKKDDDEKFKEAVEDVFSKLTRGDQLERVGKDQRVKTELLQHQEEGLDFMIQRETGDIPEQYRLWKREEEKGTIQFRHAVTGVTSQIQYPESGGGVLADDMGMGKSLSILSLVAKTSDQADDWLGHQDGPNAMLESWKMRSKATLIIVSSGLLINEWIHEMKKHLDGSINFVRYHGLKRQSLKNQLRTADIVLTTYNTLVRDFQQKQRRNHNSILHGLDFFRVVLDEAHIIRRKGTLFNQAVSELSAKSRWCLTGTPIQNKFDDIGALFAFLRVRPFHNISMFRRMITSPFDESEERRALAVKRLVTLIDSLCIRRTKARLNLPEAQKRRVELRFSDAEQHQYDKAKADMNRNLRQVVGMTKSMNDFGLFQINLQLRILCNHGTYQDPFAWKRSTWLAEREFALTSMVETGEVICSHCKQTMPESSARNIYRMYGVECRHAICDLCSDASLSDEEDDEDLGIECPICTQTELLRGVKSGPAARKALDAHYFQPFGISTKINRLVKDLRENLKEKSIVFSCWTRSLELISRHLRDAGIAFARIDGGISLREREIILEAFAERDDLPVLIMTTGTGAYGLNLTAANRIFIIEPQWNPAVENQAISRAIRLGQEKTVEVTRYIIKNTVEQDMTAQQSRKIWIAGILDQSTNAALPERDSEDESSDVVTLKESKEWVTVSTTLE